MLAVHPSPDGRGGIQGRRVVVTGVGVVAPCGIGRDAFWAGLLGPAPTGPRRVSDDFDATPLYGPKEVRRVDRFTQFAAVAAAEALGDAGGLDGDGGLEPTPTAPGSSSAPASAAWRPSRSRSHAPARTRGRGGSARSWCR